MAQENHRTLDQDNARGRLAKLNAELAEVQAQLADLAGRADVAGAEAAAHSAEQRLRNLAYDTAMAGEVVTVERTQASAQAVREAQAQLQAARTAEAEYHDLARRAAGLKEAQRAALAAVVLAGGLRLAEAHKRLSRAALRAQQATERLIFWAVREAGQPQLGGRLREALAPFPMPTADDPAKLDRAQREHEADLAAFGAGWRDWPGRLAADPQAEGPNPEDER